MTGEDLDDLLIRGYRYAFSLTGNATDAEDVLQEAWLSVLKADGPRILPYLFRAVRSRFVDQQRARKRTPLILLTSDVLEGQSLDDYDAATEMPDWIEARRMQEALHTLRSEEREALYLNAVEEWTAQEIADFWACSRNTVLSLIRRARQKMAHELGELREQRVSK